MNNPHSIAMAGRLEFVVFILFPPGRCLLSEPYFEAATLHAPAVETFHFFRPDLHNSNALASAACCDGAFRETPHIVYSADQLKGVIA
ncbi:hypothetical protein [Mesorhizobium loti]|uniref:hypothetical protein n=1 Tax=Rhizobium loti TaxID=381 RepID=UPI0012BC2E02|nr:hypothetical protein [Mesorhizobium loti]